MNLYIPEISVLETAKLFSADKKRFNAQLNEAKGILKTLEGEGQMKHPVVKMLAPCKSFLKHYIRIFQEVKDGKEDIQDVHIPDVFRNKILQAVQRRNLFFKNPEVFARYSKYQMLHQCSAYIIDDELKLSARGKFLGPVGNTNLLAKLTEELAEITEI